MEELAQLLGDGEVCGTCWVSAERYRVRPCPLCYAAERDDRSQSALPGACMCEHCGIVIHRIVRVARDGRVRVVGSTCAKKLIEKGWTRA